MGLQRLTILMFLVLILFSCRREDPGDDGIVTLISETDITYLNRKCKLLRLSLNEADLPSRQVEVRAMKPASGSKGALILTSGGFGNSFYGIGFETNTTLNYALHIGIETYEIKWLGDMGWGTNTAGAGYPEAVRAYKDILKWLKNNLISNSSVVIAHGGSGGAFQIAYGLVKFDLDQEINCAILVAGPPTSDLRRAIFGEPDDFSLWTKGIGGFAITDYIMGWKNNGDYCVNNQISPPEFVHAALDQSSILSSSESRTFAYNARIYFINTNDVTNADGQGKLYYDAITTEKEWVYLPGETSHDVSGITAGAEKIREILLDIISGSL